MSSENVIQLDFDPFETPIKPTQDNIIQLDFDPFEPSYDFKKMFAGNSPLDGLQPGHAARLNKMFDICYPDSKIRESEKYKTAVGFYLADKLKKNPDYVIQNFDSVAGAYFNSGISGLAPKEAYNKIKEIVNPSTGFGDKLVDWLNGADEDVPRDKDGVRKNASALDKAAISGELALKSQILGMVPMAHDLIQDAVSSYWNYYQKHWDTVYGVDTMEKTALFQGRMLDSHEIGRVPIVSSLENRSHDLGNTSDSLQKDYTKGKGLIQTFSDDGTVEGFKQIGLFMMAQSPQLAGQIAITAVNPAAGIVTMGAMASSDEYRQVKYDDSMSPLAKWGDIIAVGTFEAACENIFSVPIIKRMLGDTPTAEIIKKLADKFEKEAGKKLTDTELKAALIDAMKLGAGKALKEAGADTLREGTGEGLTQLLQNTSNLLAGKEGVDVSTMNAADIMSYVSQGVPDSFIGGMALGGPMGSVAVMQKYKSLPFSERDLINARIMQATEFEIKQFDEKQRKSLIPLTAAEKEQYEFFKKNIRNPEAILRYCAEDIEKKEDDKLFSDNVLAPMEEEIDAVTDSGSHASPTFTAPDSSSSGSSIVYNTESEKARFEDSYKEYLDNRLEDGTLLPLRPEQYDALVKTAQDFPLQKSFNNKLGENISFAASPGQSPLDYIQHFITKRNHDGVNKGKESFSEDHLTDYQRMIDTFENYDERILGEYKGQDRVYYVKHLSDPADKRNPEHLFIVGVDDSGRAVGFKLVADNQFSTRKNYVEKMRTIEKDLISERGLRDSSGFGSDFTYDDYLVHKDDQPFYLKRPADQNAELKPETDAGTLESLSAAAEKSRAVLEGKPETAISKDDVRKLASEYFPNRQIELIDSDAELKSYLLKNGVSEEDASEISSQEARGIWVNGIIVIRPDYIETKEEAVKTLIHEIVGHDGLRGVFGSDFKRINNMLAEHYRIDKTLPDWERLSEERFAEESETIALNPKAQPGRIRRVWTSLKLLFSRYFKGIRFSDRDIASIVRMSYKYAQKTELQQIGDDIRYSLAGANSVNNLSAQEREAAKDSIFKAVIMETRGESADKIRLATGWYRSKVDSHLRYEIDDSGMKILPREEWLGKLKKGAKLSDIIEHPELFKFYPEMADSKVKLTLRPDAIAYVFGDDLYFGGWINDETSKGVTNFRQILLHELQHLIQYKEGFARGGSPQEFVKGKKSGSAIIDGVEISDAALQKYFNLAGEKEARDTQSRADMDVRERKLYKPFGVDADKKAIVRYSLKHENEYDSIKKDIEANPGKYRDAEGRLLAPNGNPSKLNEQQYIQVRTASFKEWFGDWELSRRMEKETVVTPVRDDVLTGSNIKELRESANKLRPEILGLYLNSDQQWEIEVNDSSFTHAFYNLGAVNIHLVPSLPDLVKNAVLLESEAHQPPSEYYAAVHRFYSAITFRNKLYAVKLTIKEHVEKGRRLYDHQATEIEEIKTPSGNVLPSDDPQGELNGPALGGKISISRLLKNVKEYNEKLTSVSKAVDENGEPLVVYHGSAPDKPFSIFRRRYERDGFKSSSEAALNHRFGIGIFFSSNSEVAKDFGNNVRSFFLNIRWLMENNLGGVDYYDGVLYDPETGEKYLDDDGNPMKVDSKHLPNEAAEDFLGDSDDDTRGIVIRDVYEKIPIKGFPMPALQDTWIVGSPFQIKSATDNVGSFDKANSDIRYKKTDKPLAQLTEEERIFHFAVLGAEKIARGYKNAAVWQDRMITDFGIDIKPQLKEIYKQSLAILQKIKEKTGTSESKSQYVNDFIGMFSDEMYETDKSDMQFDSRVARLVKNGSPEELSEAFEYVEGVLAKEKSGKAQNIGYIDSLYDLGKKLANSIQKSNQDIHELRKKARAEKLKRKKENAADVRKAVLAFAEEQKEQEEEKKEDWRAQNERNYDRWKEENYPLIWSIEDKYHGLIKASSRFAGQQEDFKGASYVSLKEGYPSDLAADELGMDEDSLMEYLQDISRSRLRNEFSRYQKQMSEYMNEAKSEEAKAGDAVSAALTEAKREAFGKGWRKGYGDANRKSSERIKELQTLLRSDLDDIGNLQGKLRDYIKKFIPQEYRAKLLDSVVKIARASARPTAKNPFGARKVLFEATLKKISELSEKYEKDSLIEKINDLLDRSAVRKDKSGRPVGKLGADAHVRLSEIRRITRMSPEAVELDLEESVQKLSTGGEGNLEEDEIEKLERHIADLHMFGSLSLKTVPDLKEAQENLDELIENGRTVYDQAINERNAKRKEEREKLFDEISGGKGLMSANAEAAAAAKRSKAGHLTSYNHMRSLSFEWLMNAITRKSNSETLGGFAHQLAMDVHEATIREESGIRNKSDEFNEAFKRIYKAKTWFQFKKKMEACREIKENSGVIVERGWTIKEETVPLNEAIRIVEHNELIRSGKKKVSANDIDAPRLLQDYQLESLKQQIRDYNYKYSKYQTPVRGSRENEGSLRDEEVQERVNERELDNKDNINCKIPVKTKSENVEITQENLALSQDTALYMWLMKEQKDVKYRMEINGWTEESFKQLEAFLMPETLELGKWMREELANDKDSINAVFERDYHIRLPDVENYFPVRNDVASGRADSVMLDSHSGISSLIPGSFISRVHNFSEPKFASATGIYAEHFAQMEHFKAWSGTMIRLRGIFQSRSVRKAIEQNVSPDAYRVVQERLNYFADGGNRKATSHYWLDVVRSNFVAAKLIYSVSVFTSQLASYPAYMLDIPISSFVKYQAQFFLDPAANYAEIKDIMANSEYFRNRFSGGADRDVMAYLRQCQELSGGMPGIIEKTVEAGAITNKVGDAIPALAAGWSVYKYHYDRALNQGMNKDEAREHAITEWGMATDRSLQGGHLKDQGIYQAGGSVEKLFTMFLSAPRLYYQHVSETLLDAAAGRKGARKDLGRKAFIALVVLPVLFQASKDFLRYLKEGDDFELELRDYLLSCFLAPVTGIYLLGTAADLGARYLFGNSRQIGDFSPVFSSLKSAAFTVRDIQKFFDDKDSNDVLKVITEMSDALAPASKSVGLFSAFLREGKRIGHWFGFFEDEDNLRKKYMRN